MLAVVTVGELLVVGVAALDVEGGDEEGAGDELGDEFDEDEEDEEEEDWWWPDPASGSTYC